MLEIDRPAIVRVDQAEVPQLGPLIEVGHAGGADLQHDLGQRVDEAGIGNRADEQVEVLQEVVLAPARSGWPAGNRRRAARTPRRGCSQLVCSLASRSALRRYCSMRSAYRCAPVVVQRLQRPRADERLIEQVLFVRMRDRLAVDLRQERLVVGCASGGWPAPTRRGSRRGRSAGPACLRRAWCRAWRWPAASRASARSAPGWSRWKCSTADARACSDRRPLRSAKPADSSGRTTVSSSPLAVTGPVSCWNLSTNCRRSSRCSSVRPSGSSSSSTEAMKSKNEGLMAGLRRLARRMAISTWRRSSLGDAFARPAGCTCDRRGSRRSPRARPAAGWSA